MDPDQRKGMSRRALEMWESGNTDRPEEVFTHSYVNHQEPDVAGGVSAKNLGSWNQLRSDFRDAFSDCNLDISMQIADGDLVATKWQLTATHSGEYMGAAPTGKRISWTGVEIDRFEGDKVAESWVDWDKYHLFEELGLAP